MKYGLENVRSVDATKDIEKEFTEENQKGILCVIGKYLIPIVVVWITNINMKMRISKDLPVRMFKCFRNWKKWRQANKLASAAVVLWNGLYNYDLALKVKEESDLLYKEIMK